METSPVPAADPRSGGADRGDPRRPGRSGPRTPGGRAGADRPGAGRRRRRVLAGLGTVAVVAATGLVAGLLTWGPQPPRPTRALTAAEADRLAAVRVTNYRDGRSGVRATIGAGGTRTEVVGWVDWSRPLLYLDVGGPGAGPLRGLVQARPDLVAVRPDPAAVLTPARPPLTPPADGWRVRALPAGTPLAALLELFFALSADRPDPAEPLRSARWVSRDTLGRIPVDVFQVTGGTAPGTAGPPADGARYWVDRDARLHRLRARLPGRVPVTVELDRTQRTPLLPVDVLGGRPGLPRELTREEADRLAGMPARNRALGGVALSLAVPTGAGANLRGGGWLDWAGQVAYLGTVDLDAPAQRTLARYDRTGVARTTIPVVDEDPAARPPLPPPADPPWRHSRTGPAELDRLVAAALRVGQPPGEAGPTRWLRRDSTGRRQVDVIESHAGRNVLRYWIDRAGLLRRLELRTPAGAWAQLDLVQAPVPRLPTVPTG